MASKQVWLSVAVQVKITISCETISHVSVFVNILAPEIAVIFFMCNFPKYSSDWYLEHFQWNFTSKIYISILVQIIACGHQATSHYLSECWPRSILLYGITRPQWNDNFLSMFSLIIASQLYISCKLGLYVWWSVPWLFAVPVPCPTNGILIKFEIRSQFAVL